MFVFIDVDIDANFDLCSSLNMAIEQFGMGSIEATHNVTRGVYTWVLRDIFEHKILFVTVAERSMVKVSLSVSTYVDCFVCDKGLENKYV